MTPKKIEIGRLRFLVEVFQPGRTSDGAGGSKRADVKLGETMADIRPANASELFRAQRAEMVISHVIIMRQLVNMGHKYVIKHDGKEYNVTRFMDEDNRKRFWTIWANEGGPK